MSSNWSELVELERTLWRLTTRNDSDYLDRILHPDFVEFGMSGRVWSRAEILRPGGEFTAEVSNFAVDEVAPGVALVTYVSRLGSPETARANRSSVWLRVDNRWLLRFHQGTAAQHVNQEK